MAGRHRTPPPPPLRTARRVAGTARPAAARGYRTGRQGTRIAHRGIAHGGQHALMAEFLLFCGVVGLRAVADYVPEDQGAAKGEITPGAGQLGPLPILAAGFVFFFLMSFMAARGGTWAKVAAAAGLILDVALLLRSAPELEKVSGAFGNVAGTSTSTDNAASGPNNAGSAPTSTGA